MIEVSLFKTNFGNKFATNTAQARFELPVLCFFRFQQKNTCFCSVSRSRSGSSQFPATQTGSSQFSANRTGSSQFPVTRTGSYQFPVTRTDSVNCILSSLDLNSIQLPEQFLSVFGTITGLVRSSFSLYLATRTGKNWF